MPDSNAPQQQNDQEAKAKAKAEAEAKAKAAREAVTNRLMDDPDMMAVIQKLANLLNEGGRRSQAKRKIGVEATQEVVGEL